ncbi:MAG TPA: MotA/TolQ/ExbB proton channel family protein [Oscillospiraceae bacterium]|nr:MotA/TolQ/ExbB proton channel family protein [Oscillospiraceae bacterium]
MKRKLNITGIIGLVAALGLIAVIGMAYGTDANGKPAVIMSQMMNFWDPASVAITVGGTIGGIIFMFPAKILKNAGKMVGMVFNQRKYNPDEYIENMVEYCKIARLKGILQLEESANECKDPFMKSALMLIVDANDSEKVQAMLDDSIDFMCERHEANISMWLKASSSAPAFGMIGTLVGLINMLAALDPTDSGSAASLGAGMATALITTFYGCIMANVIFNPIANQLKYTHNDEVLCMQIIEEGALAIISGANPRYVQEKLEMMLPKNSGKKSKKQEK